MDRAPLAIVFGGGGARAAYQVGYLRWLARRMPDLSIPIFTGVSMGAINAVHMARSRGSFSDAVDGLVSLWGRVTSDRVARSDWTWVGGVIVRSIARAIGVRRTSPRPLAPLDTSPLRAFLADAFDSSEGDIAGIADNLASDRLSAVAVTTTDLGAGCSTTWVQAKQQVAWQDEAGHRGVAATLSLDHLMATMAVPFLFPAVRLGNSWHADGVIRQSTPLLPAVKLGAGRILSISSRHAGGSALSARLDQGQYPAPAHVGGILLHSVLESMLDVNAHLLEEIRVLAGKLPERDRPETLPAHALVLRPSRDLGKMAAGYESRLPRSSRLLARGLGAGGMKNLDLYSNLVFDPQYIAALIALGEEDAESKGREIEALVDGR